MGLFAGARIFRAKCGGLFLRKRGVCKGAGNGSARLSPCGSGVAARKLGGTEPAFKRGSTAHCTRTWPYVFGERDAHQGVCGGRRDWPAPRGFLLFIEQKCFYCARSSPDKKERYIDEGIECGTDPQSGKERRPVGNQLFAVDGKRRRGRRALYQEAFPG